MTQKSNAILEKLQGTLAEVKKEGQELALTITQETEEDYKYSRDKMKALIDQSEEAIQNMMSLASDTEHPRAFEVLAGMFKTTSDMLDQLMTLQKKRKELVVSDNNSSNDGGPSIGTQNNNIVFSGSASDLQRMFSGPDIKDAMKNESIS